MAPKRKKSVQSGEQSESSQVVRISKLECEKKICKKKLDVLELEESWAKEDRFSASEKRQLLEAFNENGFCVFQDTKLLQRYLPNRQEVDLKGLVRRLSDTLQQPSSRNLESSDAIIRPERSLDEWQKLCQQLMGNFARDKRVSLDDMLAEALMTEAEEQRQSNLVDILCTTSRDDTREDKPADLKPDYPALLDSFAQLLVGKFPDNMSLINAQISMKLFDHINSVVDTLDLKHLSSLADGTWLEQPIEEGRRRMEMALEGLKRIDGKTKKCPTLRDLERDRNMEALCLELPKIKRITDLLNPLHIDESLVSFLMG